MLKQIHKQSPRLFKVSNKLSFASNPFFKSTRFYAECCKAKQKQNENITVSTKEEVKINEESQEKPQAKQPISPKPPVSIFSPGFFTDSNAWRRSVVNTLHCLVGCSIGDFGMLYLLYVFAPGTSMLIAMPLAMASGIASSLTLETLRLKYSEKFSWSHAFKVSLKMSLISMLAMELAENLVDILWTVNNNSNAAAVGEEKEEASGNHHKRMSTIEMMRNMKAGDNALFKGDQAALQLLFFSLLAGFLAPLPYNYIQLKKFARSCH